MTDQQPKQETEKHPDVKAHFINRLTGMFKRVPGSDEKQYFRSIRHSLERFPADVLNEAAQMVMENSTTQTWPLLGVCVQACQKVQAERAAAERKDRHETKPAIQRFDFWMPEDVAIGCALKEDPDLMRRAAQGDWHVPVIDYRREHRHLPDDRTCRDIAAKCAEFDERRGEMILEAEATLRSELGTKAKHLTELPANHMVQRFANAIARRRNKLRKQILEHFGEYSEAAE